MVAQLLRLKLFASGELSIAAALIFAASLLTGVVGLTIVSLLVVVTSLLSEERFDLQHIWERKLELGHDWAIGLLAGLAPAIFPAIFNVPLQMAYLPLLFVPLFLVIVAYSYSGVGLIALTISITNGKRFWQVWNDDFQQAPGQYMLMSMVGVCLTMIYAMFGVTGFLLSVLPIFFMRFAQEPVVARWANLTAILSRHLRPAQHGFVAEDGYSASYSPALLEVDQTRIERYLQFRDNVRTA